MVLGTLMAIMIPTLVWSAHEYRLSQEREEAAAEVANIVERLTMQPWESLTPETGRGIRLSSWTEQQLRDASLTVQIGVEPDDPTAKRIHVNIAWTEHAGEPAAPVRLTAWVYQREDSP